MNLYSTAKSSKKPARRGLAFIKTTTIIFVFFLGIIVFMANRDLGADFFSVMAKIPGGDKTGHFMLMGIFSFLMNIILSGSRIHLGPASFLKGSLIVFIIVTLEELSQIFISARSCSISDLFFDYAGIFCFGRLALYLKQMTAQTRP
ncbi:VanZ family protein [Verrucomicrobiota bacterium]